MDKTPPPVVTITLEDKDVQEDLVAIVKAMTAMRAEALQGKEVTAEQKDEYLHLTYRLASGVKGLADKDMAAKAQFIVNAANKNSALLHYDPLQDMYWQGKMKGFSQTLDALLIGIVRDMFEGTDAKHHIFQAIKYLGVGDEPFHEKEKVYDTIVPFHGALSTQEAGNGLLSKLVGFFAGAKYKTEHIPPLTLRVTGGDIGFIDSVIEFAKARGYTALQLHMPHKVFEAYKQQFKNAAIKHVINDTADAKGKKEFVLVELPLRQLPQLTAFTDHIPLYDAIAALAVSEEAEQNLVWSEKNNAQFGQKFIRYVNSKIEDEGKKPSAGETKAIINREYQTVTYQQSAVFDGHRKDSSLFCLHGERYRVTAVSPVHVQQLPHEKILHILRSQQDPGEIAKQLSKETQATYLRLKRFANATLTHDYEVTK